MGFMDAYLNQTKSLQVYTTACGNVELTQVIMSVYKGLPKDSGCKFASEMESYQKIAIFSFPKCYRKYLSFSKLQPDLTD